MLDIRSETPAKIKEIRFADDNNGHGGACLLVLNDGEVLITDDDYESTMVITDEFDAENIIKAIRKAIDLGWWE